MKKLATISSRFLAGILTVSILTVSLYLPTNAPKAEAFIVHDPINAGILLGMAATDVTDLTITNVLNGIAWMVAKTAIQSMTRSIVNWINGGFNGSPAFETDLKRSLGNVADGVAQGFLTTVINEEAVHSPFIDNLVTNVGTAYYLYSGRESLKARLRYTLAQSAADDRAFLAGDFNQGGWGAWFSAFMNPANNPYGAQMIASELLSEQISSSVVQRVAELGWGSGFMSWRGDCIQDSDGSDAVALSEVDSCQQYSVKTPGSVIESSLIQNVNSPLHQLELADSINEIIGALAQQLVSQVIGGGGLSGVSRPSQGGGSSYLDQTYANSNQASANLIAGFKQNIANIKKQVAGYRKNWQTIGAAAERAKTFCGNNPEKLEQPIQASIEAARLAAIKADDATSALELMETKIAAANGAPSASLMDALSREYQMYLADGTIPGPSEISDALNESRDSGDQDPPSLYTQLTRLATPFCGGLIGA